MRARDALASLRGDPSGMVFDPAELEQGASAVLLAKEIGSILERHYAGHRWYLEVDDRGGIIKIFAGTCSGQWGYILKLADVQSSPGALRRAIVQAGGEILERFHQPAGPYNREAWLAAPRYLTGELKPDLSDKSAKVRRRERDEAIDDAIKKGALELKHVDEGGERHIIVRESRARDPADTAEARMRRSKC